MAQAEAAANADHAELARFDAVAARWWDRDGPMRALHDLNPARLAYIAARCPMRGARVLDVGCGGGILSEALAVAGSEVSAIDLAAEALLAARLHAAESGLAIDYQQRSVESLAEEAAGRFDLVCCMEMLEHVPDPGAILAACARLLKPGGWLMLSTLNRHPKAFALGIVAAEYLLGLLPRGTHRYDRFIKPSELRRCLRGLGLEGIEFSGLHYDPIGRQARQGEDLSVNYLAAARKPGLS